MVYDTLFCFAFLVFIRISAVFFIRNLMNGILRAYDFDFYLLRIGMYKKKFSANYMRMSSTKTAIKTRMNAKKEKGVA